jgi:WD40 repeat protein
MKQPIKIITGSNIIFDTSFHPAKNILAMADIDGLVTFHDLESNTLVKQHHFHTDSIRNIEFTNDGSLWSCSTDGSIALYNLEYQTIFISCKNSHKYPINKIKPITNDITVTADEKGRVKLWDIRIGKVISKYHVHKFVSDVGFSKNQLCITGGDQITVMDIRMDKNRMESIGLQDSGVDDIHCIECNNNDSKIVLGRGSGMISRFSLFPTLKEIQEFPGHASCITGMIQEQQQLYTCSEDGMIRVLELDPEYQLLGIIGDHDDCIISMSKGDHVLATTGTDEIVKIWDSRMDLVQQNVFGVDFDDLD